MPFCCFSLSLSCSCSDLTYNNPHHLTSITSIPFLSPHTHTHTAFWGFLNFVTFFSFSFLISHNIKGLVFLLARKQLLQRYSHVCVCVSKRSLGPRVDLASFLTDQALISADPLLAGEEVTGKIMT